MSEAAVRSVTIQFDTRIPAVYLYLGNPVGFSSRRSKQIDPGVVVDFDEQGVPVGIELLGPQDVDAVLRKVLPYEHAEILKRLESKRKILDEILSASTG